MSARKIYENETTKAREKELLKRILSKKPGFTAEQLTHTKRLDYILRDPEGRSRAAIELKCRNIRSNQYPDICLSEHKFRAFNKFSQYMPVYLFIAFKDGIDMLYKYEQHHLFPTVRGGRTKDTRDRWDVEQCVYIPMKYFKVL